MNTKLEPFSFLSVVLALGSFLCLPIVTIPLSLIFGFVGLVRATLAADGASLGVAILGMFLGIVAGVIIFVM